MDLTNFTERNEFRIFLEFCTRKLITGILSELGGE